MAPRNIRSILQTGLCLPAFLLITCQIGAQINQDSLWSIWLDDSKADTTRAGALYKYHYEGFPVDQPDSIYHYAQLQYEFAQEKGLKKEMAQALKEMGFALNFKGSYPDAISYYARSLAILESLGNTIDMARVLINMGISYKNLGEFTTARKYLERSLQPAEEVGNTEVMTWALNQLGETASQQGNYLQAKKYLERSLKIAEASGDDGAIASAHFGLGYYFSAINMYTQALSSYRKSLQYYEKIQDKYEIGSLYNNIGQIYTSQGDHATALSYYKKVFMFTPPDEIDLDAMNAIPLDNIGRAYLSLGQLDSAEVYLRRSLRIREQAGHKMGIANSYASMGWLYDVKGDLLQSLAYHEKGLQLHESIGSQGGIARVLSSIGWIHLKRKDFKQAIAVCKKSNRLATEIGLLWLRRRTCNCLYNGYKGSGNTALALEFHEKWQNLNDSISAEETSKRLQEMEFQNQLLEDSIETAEAARLVKEAHAEEIRRKNQARDISLGIGFFVLLIAGGLYSRLRYIRKSKQLIEQERDRSDELLLNILPAEIAQELKENGKAAARDFDMVSILFTDFQGFTQTSSRLSPQELVAEINVCFEAFDRIISRHGIEKIKTIGDAYMAAGGLPVPTADSAKHTVLAALEMQAFISERKAANDASGQTSFQMRCGVHTGPVVAGIVGVKKFQYDVWGDTVNIASRMENKGEVGKVNISQDTYELLRDDPQFNFEKRGKVQVKGKGEMEMWYVS